MTHSRRLQASCPSSISLQHIRTRQFISILLLMALSFNLGPATLARGIADFVIKSSGRADRVVPEPMNTPSNRQDVNQAQSSNRGMPPVEQLTGITPLPPLSRDELEERVARIELNVARELNLEPGENLQLMAVPVDNVGDPVHGLSAEWESMTPQFLSISRDGRARGLSSGIGLVKAQVGRRSSVITVRVATRLATLQDSNVTNRDNIRLNSKKSGSRRGRWRSLAHTSAAPARVPAMPPPDEEQRAFFAPNNAVGFPPGKTPPGAITRAAATNGTETGSANFNFPLPVVNLPGRGLDVDLTLFYNSRLWKKFVNILEITNMTYNPDAGWPAPGFHLGYGKLTFQNNRTVMLVDSDGTRHKLVDPSVSPNPPTYTYEATDGTFVRLTTVNNGSPIVATYPGGTQVEFGANGGTTTYYPMKITDRNGNFVDIAYAGTNGAGPRIFSIRDTLARYVYFHYASNDDLVTITAPDLISGSRQLMRFYYENISLPYDESGHFEASYPQKLCMSG